MPDTNTPEETVQEQTLNDGLENLATGLGTGLDKNSHNVWTRSNHNADFEQLITRYREDWVAQKTCNIIPQDMTRKWRRIDTEAGVQADIDFRIRDMFREAYIWARVFGTSAIILDIRGAGSAETPLNLKRLRPGCIRSMQVVDRTRLMPTGSMVSDPFDPEYGMPEFYMLGGSTVRIHKSRVLRFEGTALTKYEIWRNQWYSDSVLIPLLSTIDNFHVAAQSASALTHEANADVVSVEGLQNLLTHPAGEAAVMRRFRLMKQMKSIHNIILLDSTEEFSTKTIALNGVKDLIWEYLRIIAAAVGIPATRFLSASPDGMNSTGESDLNNYIDLITGAQNSVFDPRLEVVDRLLQAHYGIPEYSYEWNCVFPESALQKEDRRNKLADSLNKLVTGGILSPEGANRVLKEEHIFGDIDLGAPPPPPKQEQGSTKK